MPKKVKTRDVVVVNYGMWIAAWEVDTPYIDVFGNTADMRQLKAAYEKGETPEYTAVHCINTNGDFTKWAADPKAYVKDELKAWADEDGAAYTAAGY